MCEEHRYIESIHHSEATAQKKASVSLKEAFTQPNQVLVVEVERHDTLVSSVLAQ